MSENQMLQAYRHLLDNAKESLIKLEMKSWHLLGKAVHEVEEKGSVLEQLTEKQLEQVRQDVEADIVQVGEYLAEVGEGVESFIEMDLPILEGYLEEKALSLADPTDITILRLRLNAAMSGKD